MSLAVFPNQIRGLTWPVGKSAEFSTVVQKADNLATTRIDQAPNPLWHWDLMYEYIKDNPLDLVPALLGQTDYRYLQGFYLARLGQWDDFLFNDIYDNSVTNQSLQLVTDGTNWYSPIQRTFGGQFNEDITDLQGALTLFENGSPSSTGYVLFAGGLSIPGFSSSGLYIKWNSEPTAPITASFGWYFRVRFDVDEQAFDQFMQYLWTVGGTAAKKSDVIKLVGAPPLLNGTGASSSGGLIVPSPPIAPPTGATQSIVLYPATFSFSNGWTDLTHSVPNIAYGFPGSSAQGWITTPHVGLGFVPPAVGFAGYILPTLPVGMFVKGVYSYDVNAAVFGGAGTPNGFLTLAWTGGGNTITPNFFDIVRLDTGSGGSFPAATFPISSVSQTFALNASIGATFNPPAGYTYAPRLVVFFG